MNMSAPRDAGGLLQALATLFWIPQAALLAWAVQRVIGGDTAPLGYLAAGVLALGAMRAMLDALGARLAFRTARAALTDLRARLALALAMRSPLDRGRPAAGLAASAMAEQAGAVVPYWARFRPARLRAAIVPVVILTVVLTLSWAAAVVLLVAAPLIPLFMVLIGWRAQAASAAQIVEVGAMNGFLLDRLRGLATIRALDAVDATARRLRADAESLRRRTMAVLRIAFLSSAVLELFAALGVAVVAVYVGFHLLGWLDFGTWHGRLSLGQGLFILLLAPAFFEPLRELSAVWHDRAAGEAALAELETLTIPGMPLPAAAEVPILGARSAAPPAVWLDGVAFRYPGDSGPVLRGFDLAVKPGEKVALLGPSGVGKSTLLALIAGLAPIEAGCLTIDDILSSAGTAAALRTRMAWIGQRPHLFAGSIRSNVSLGRATVGAAEREAALRFAALETVAAAHVGGIGEGGLGLSGGEALRLALARAAADPRIDLILADEPTAHLDAATAETVTRGLLALAAGRTLIVATHDPVFAAQMDRIVHVGART